MDLQDILNPAPPAARPPAPSRFRGHISSPPPPGSPLAYDEDPLVTLILSIFNLLIRIGHLGTLHLIFPGDPRHNIDEALCAELNLDARVISLLKRLPYFAQPGYSEAIMIAPGSFMPNYLDPAHLRQGRQMYALPGYAEPEPDWPGLRPEDVVLLYNIEFDQLSDTWILDTEASMYLSLSYPGPCFIVTRPAYTLNCRTDSLIARYHPSLHLLFQFCKGSGCLPKLPACFPRTGWPERPPAKLPQ